MDNACSTIQVKYVETWNFSYPVVPWLCGTGFLEMKSNNWKQADYLVLWTELVIKAACDFLWPGPGHRFAELILAFHIVTSTLSLTINSSVQKAKLLSF